MFVVVVVVVVFCFVCVCVCVCVCVSVPFNWIPKTIYSTPLNRSADSRSQMLLEHLSGLQFAELCTQRTLMCVAYLLSDDRRSFPLSHRDRDNLRLALFSHFVSDRQAHCRPLPTSSHHRITTLTHHHLAHRTEHSSEHSASSTAT